MEHNFSSATGLLDEVMTDGRTITYGTANALNQYPSVTHPSSSGTRWGIQGAAIYLL